MAWARGEAEARARPTVVCGAERRPTDRQALTQEEREGSAGWREAPRGTGETARARVSPPARVRSRPVWPLLSGLSWCSARRLLAALRAETVAYEEVPTGCPRWKRQARGLAVAQLVQAKERMTALYERGMQRTMHETETCVTGVIIRWCKARSRSLAQARGDVLAHATPSVDAQVRCRARLLLSAALARRLETCLLYTSPSPRDS